MLLIATSFSGTGAWPWGTLEAEHSCMCEDTYRTSVWLGVRTHTGPIAIRIIAGVSLACVSHPASERGEDGGTQRGTL